MTKTVVALFDDFNAANEAVRDLVDHGFSREDISLMANDAGGQRSVGLDRQEVDTTPTSGATEGAGVGAGIGAVLGGLGGLLVGLGALAIPGIGPVIAAGPLAAALTGLAGAGVGAVAGGVTGGLLGALTDMGIPNETAQYYAEGIRRGGTLVTLRASDEMTNQAVDVLNAHNPIDINQRAAQWRETGWAGFNPESEPYHKEDTFGRDVRPGMMDTQPPATMEPRHEETSWRSGTTAMESHPEEEMVHHEDEKKLWPRDELRAPDEQPGTEVERQLWPERTETREEARDRAESMMETPMEEEHKLWPREELRPADEMPGTEVERDLWPERTHGREDDMEEHFVDASHSSYDFSHYDDRFRSHFDTTYSAAGSTYDQYLPAYRYGYDLAQDNRYRDYNWDQVEPEAHRYWDERNPGTWDRFKMAVRHAWEEIKEGVD